MFTSPERVVCVSCRALCPRPLESQVERIAAAGVKRLILREKDLSESEYLALAERVYVACERHGVELTIHNFPQAARALGIRKLHMPLKLLTSELCEEFDVVGSSVHSVDEAMSAQAAGARYVTAGHIFATDCKRGLAPRGIEFLRGVCKAADIDVYAIGGINEGNLAQVLEAGAQAGCVMSGLMRI
jgi:thiamine-phosphate pyrophosphorylase